MLMEKCDAFVIGLTVDVRALGAIFVLSAHIPRGAIEF